MEEEITTIEINTQDDDDDDDDDTTNTEKRISHSITLENINSTVIAMREVIKKMQSLLKVGGVVVLDTNNNEINYFDDTAWGLSEDLTSDSAIIDSKTYKNTSISARKLLLENTKCIK